MVTETVAVLDACVPVLFTPTARTVGPLAGLISTMMSVFCDLNRPRVTRHGDGNGSRAGRLCAGIIHADGANRRAVGGLDINDDVRIERNESSPRNEAW